MHRAARACLITALVLVPPNSVLAQNPSPSLPVSPSPQPTATSSPATWTTTTDIENFGKQLESFNNATTTVISVVVKVGALLFSLVLLQRLLWLMLRRRPELVIENFADASGKDELSKVLPGLTQLARQELIREIKGVRQRVKEHVRCVGPERYRPSDVSPLPQATSDQRLTSLLASIKEFAPTQLSPIFQLINILFPPFGTKVTGLLQSKDSSPEKLGLTIEITDIQGELVPRLYTIWEPQSKKAVDSEVVLPELTIKDRYITLLRPVARWLALELSRREMVVKVPLGQDRKRYQGQIHNFFGVLNYASAQTHGNFFYQLAIEDLQQAIELCPNWYQPYENLADTYSTKGREEQGKIKIDLQRKAILNYNSALERVIDEPVANRIRLSKAIALLLLADKDSIDEANNEIELIKKKWNPVAELDSRFLYNLAVWHLTYKSQGFGDKSTVQLARLYLAYSLARSRKFWDWAIKDPDLEEIRNDLPDLQFHLSRSLREMPDINKCIDKEFEEIINKIFEKIGWKFAENY
ncbi:hypothetical protein H6G89_23250 [Oscillatoria sp. FACHB-1407]|uniref:hypothetical protein n=1 Tax=Oscillatoria sp. FACHB-1407 TaxID=2692847 RepID=UPI001685850B|nr:hypothetical protein [Oscillatoria sp. FACHB-1407]MBD2463923.1 hypothetical protein [Oscillatoria sp. FACHB-1407]